MTDNTGNRSSYHIFTFPFKWDFKPKDKLLEETDFSTRTSLNEFDKLLRSNSDWEKNTFKINDPSDFNEYIYFYDFAREALYPNEKNSETLSQYEIKTSPQSLYKIKIKDSNEPYTLPIDKILLTIYFTGVGVLSFHLANNRYTEFSDILRINEFGRRLYPQFLGGEPLTQVPKIAFLAESLEVRIDNKRRFKEDFKDFDKKDKLDANRHRLSEIIMGVLGDAFYTESKDERKDKSGIRISPILDDRMFVLCWLADQELCKKLSLCNDVNTYAYSENDDWYKLVFIDKDSPSCTSIPMKKRLLTEHTYDRWIGPEWSSLFGVTRYSFIVLNDNPVTFVKDHLKTMYFRMVQLALVQRASILRFSDEASRIADMKEHENTTENLSKLQKKYLQFINKIYFREITAFEQGIELYEKIVEAMKIERDVKTLDQEIEELHHYASLQEEKRRNDLLTTLSIIGALFLIPAFITGFFGMNTFSEGLKVAAPGKLWVILGVILIACLIVTLGIIRHDKRKKTALIGLGVVVILILMILSVIYFG
ncbi:MAG: CorA family divalent cation transporter [Candidatus Omnitrophota bacterium]